MSAAACDHDDTVRQCGSAEAHVGRVAAAAGSRVTSRASAVEAGRATGRTGSAGEDRQRVAGSERKVAAEIAARTRQCGARSYGAATSSAVAADEHRRYARRYHQGLRSERGLVVVGIRKRE